MERALGYVAVMCLASQERDGVRHINPDPEAAHWTVQFRWRDEQGRFCTRFLCDAYGQHGGESAQATAERIASALAANAALNNENRPDPI